VKAADLVALDLHEPIVKTFRRADSGIAVANRIGDGSVVGCA
jgi:hypothetical protein